MALRGLDALAARLEFGAIAATDEQLSAGLVTLILRVAFVLMAEQRELMPVGLACYRERYSLTAWLQDPAEPGWSRHRRLFAALDHNALGWLPQGAALFAPERAPLLERGDFSVSDAALRALLQELGRGQASTVACAGFDGDSLGALYEGLVGHAVCRPSGSAARVEPTVMRRRSGAHYTCPSLTRDLVSRTLSPLLAGEPTAERILGLRIGDPAVGSGAFLVEACRQLGDALWQAWQRSNRSHASIEQARRLVAEHCLYGLDRDPMAVALARLSLWLLVGGRDCPFALWDDKLTQGDALLGLNRSHLESLSPPGASKAFGVDRWRDLGDLLLSRWLLAKSGRERQRQWQKTAAQAERILTTGPTGAESREGTEARQLYHPFHWEVQWSDILGEERGGFDALVGNPPWVAYAGRAAQPLAPELRDWYLFTSPAFAGYRTLHGLFVHRAATLLRAGGRLGLVVPTSLSDLGGYEPVRRAHDALSEPDSELPDYGNGAFAGVFQPCMGLVSTRRQSPVEPARGGVWPLARQDLGPEDARLLERLDALPKLGRELFGERGYQTRSIDARQMRAAQAPSGRFDKPLRTGSEVEPFRARSPRLFCDPTALAGRFRSDREWHETKLFIRQTARYPMAARSDGLPFRNSVLAGFANSHVSAQLLLVWLNSAPVRWFHYQKNRDARQGMPQVKIAHLRDLPAPPPAGSILGDLERLGRELGERNQGVGPAEQLLIDGSVARALELDASEVERIAAWAVQTRG